MPADMPQAAAQRKARSVSGPNGRAAEARLSAADMRCIAYSFFIETILAMGPRYALHLQETVPYLTQNAFSRGTNSGVRPSSTACRACLAIA